jgi:hypothetical protein
MILERPGYGGNTDTEYLRKFFQCALLHSLIFKPISYGLCLKDNLFCFNPLLMCKRLT